MRLWLECRQNVVNLGASECGDARANSLFGKWLTVELGYVFSHILLWVFILSVLRVTFASVASRRILLWQCFTTKSYSNVATQRASRATTKSYSNVAQQSLALLLQNQVLL